MSAKVVLHPAFKATLAEDILNRLHLEMISTSPLEEPLTSVFQCQRCEWEGPYPPVALVPEEQCEFPYCPACGSFSVIFQEVPRAHGPQRPR